MITDNFKIADLIHANYHILPIINRFGINLGVGDLTINQICSKYSINSAFFIEVVNVFLYDDYDPIKNLPNINVADLLSYLKNSHKYFISVKIDSLDKKLNAIIEFTTHNDQKIAQIIRNFYNEYKNELLEHIYFEEQTIFPYINQLIDNNFTTNNQFNISQFLDKHTNIEDKIYDLKNFFIKYLQLPIEQAVYIDIISELFDFEKDLNKHQIFEEKVLVPIVLQLEKNK